jgi:SPP1 family predicted phage head-tail adaptor
MNRPFDRPITLQKIDEITEKWTDVYKLHAQINKAKADNEYLNAGATQGKKSLVFEVRYFKDLEDISFNLSMYRILFGGIPYDIRDYDDFQLKHKTVKLLGVSY